MGKRFRSLGLLAVALLAGPMPSNAGLVGQEFSAAFYFPDTCAVHESSSFDNTTFAFPHWNAATFNGIIFTGAGPLGIVSATVDSSTTLAGIDDSLVWALLGGAS